MLFRTHSFDFQEYSLQRCVLRETYSFKKICDRFLLASRGALQMTKRVAFLKKTVTTWASFLFKPNSKTRDSEGRARPRLLRTASTVSQQIATRSISSINAENILSTDAYPRDQKTRRTSCTVSFYYAGITSASMGRQSRLLVS
jgi:hypothetical protein